MTPEEQKRIIAEKLNEGMSLGDVQRLLHAEYGVNMTYLDLRLLASELEVDWEKQEPAEPAKPAAAAEETLLEPETDPESSGSKTRVTISKVTRPDAALNGTVDFASGAKAQWYVDQMGRLALAPEAGSSKPTEQDIREFQVELERLVRGQGY
jgi:hypothetical protein